MGIDDDNGAGTAAGPDDTIARDESPLIVENITFRFADLAQQQRFHDRLQGMHRDDEVQTAARKRIAELEADLADTLRAVLHHCGPEGAHAVTTAVLELKSKRVR